jgi:hypothetical protein
MAQRSKGTRQKNIVLVYAHVALHAHAVRGAHKIHINIISGAHMYNIDMI